MPEKTQIRGKFACDHCGKATTYFTMHWVLDYGGPRLCVECGRKHWKQKSH